MSKICHSWPHIHGNKKFLLYTSLLLHHLFTVIAGVLAAISSMSNVQGWANVGLQLFIWKRYAGYDYYNKFNNNNNNNKKTNKKTNIQINNIINK
jgi:hypothetical protein